MFLQVQPILNHPNENSIIVFVLGALFIISSYHFLLYFQLKSKVYLYYSLYTFLLFVSHLDIVESGFIPVLIEPVVKTLNYYSSNLVWLYNIVYFVFLFTFIDIKPYSLKWYKFIKYYVFCLFIYSILLEIIYVITANSDVITYGNILFTVFITVISLLVYIPLFKVDNPLKYYAISGAIVLFVTSIIATVMFIFKLYAEGNDIRFSIFYTGIIIENIFFSLGLGKKQKLILQEKDVTQNNLIKQLSKNKELQSKIRGQLEKENSLLIKEAELGKLEKIKAKFDKELAENELYALRSQMNPHFVFNSLAAIQYYINNNQLEASEVYLVKFSKLIRQFFEWSKEKEITIEQEIMLISNYIDIEKLRFKDKFEYTIHTDKKLDIVSNKLPTILLQPIVENAINHGIFNKIENGILTINFIYLDVKSFKVEIIDDGVGFINTEKKEKRKLKSSKLLVDRIKFLNQTQKWKILYSKEELNAHLYDKGNISTFIITQL